jgi:3-hydroxybutyryl-CoA dehydratase
VANFLERPVDGLAVGTRLRTRGRTITEADIVNWCSMTGDWQVLHTDAVYAQASRFGQRIAPGLMVLAFAAGLGIPPSSETIIANYGTDSLRFVAPTFIGDTLHLEAEVREITPRRPGIDAVVRCAWNMINQNGKPVMVSDLLILMAYAPATVRAA